MNSSDRFSFRVMKKMFLNWIGEKLLDFEKFQCTYIANDSMKAIVAQIYQKNFTGWREFIQNRQFFIIQIHFKATVKKIIETK